MSNKIKDFLKKLYEDIAFKLADKYRRHLLKSSLKRFGFDKAQIKEITSMSMTEKEFRTAYEQARVQALGC